MWSDPTTKAEVAARQGFVPTGEGLTWREVFDPYADAVEGRIAAIIGHFPFARGVLWKAADLQILERFPEPGNYPDTACEYLLPEADSIKNRQKLPHAKVYAKAQR